VRYLAGGVSSGFLDILRGQLLFSRLLLDRHVKLDEVLGVVGVVVPVQLRERGLLVVHERGVQDGDGVAVEPGWPELLLRLHLFRPGWVAVVLSMFRGLWAGGAATPGYGLGAADVQRIQKQMVGLPITIEHEGLLHSAEKVRRPCLEPLSITRWR
jgi:hypothetical protein